MRSRGALRRLSAAVAALALVSVGVVTTAVPSSAVTDLGLLYLSPQSGVSTDSPPLLNTYSYASPVGCPTGATNYKAVMVGPGAWASGFPIISNSPLPSSGDFAGSLADTFSGLASSNGAPLTAGKYDITLTCQNRLGSIVYGTFATSIWFTSSTVWSSTNPGGATATTTTLTASPTDTAAAGAPVTLSATVSPSAPGTVAFYDGATKIGTDQTVIAGQASVITSSLTNGSHSLTARFTPLVAGAHAQSTSSTVNYSITCSASCPTTTSLAASPTSSARLGAPVTLTATVSPAAASGSVEFFDSSSGSPVSLGSSAVSGGSAALSGITSLALGSHSLTAVFTPAGGSIYATSTSTPALSYSIVVRSTATSLSVSPLATAVPGATVTLTATVSSAESPIGTVQFTDGGSPLGSPVTVTGGQAQFATSSLSAGSHSFGAAFTATDIGFSDSQTSSSTAYSISAVVLTTTTTALAVGPNATTAVGQSVSLSATVVPSNAVGSVQFSDGATALGTPVALASGSASTVVGSLAAGSHSLTATFIPTDSNAFTSSTSSAVSHTVITAPNLGTLKILVEQNSETSGTVTDPMVLESESSSLPRGCRALGSATILRRAVVRGPGAWAGTAGSGITIVSTTSASNAVPTAGEFALPFADTLSGLAQSNGISLDVTTYTDGDGKPYTFPARFDVTVECRQNNGVTGTYASPFWLTDSTHWQSTNPNSSATVTSASIDVSPAGYSFAGQKVTLTASVVPSNAVGTVRFTNSNQGSLSNLSPAVTVTNGVATFSSSSLATGLYTIGVVFTPTNPNAFTTATAIPLTYYVRKAVPPTPQSLPTVVGSRLKLGATLTCRNGSWLLAQSTAYLWLRNGQTIAGASKSTYVLQAADGGTRVTCRVRATNPGGTVTATAPARSVPLWAASKAIRGPKISGVARVGQVLTVDNGRWSPAPTSFRYQWLRDGAVIAGAVRQSRALTAADRGHRISCRVTALRVGAAQGVASTGPVQVR